MRIRLRYIFSALFTFGIFLISCDNTKYENRNEETADRNLAKPEIDVFDDEVKSEYLESASYEIKNVNEEVRAYIKDGQIIVEEFIQNEKKDFQVLAQDLKKINQKIDRVNEDEKNQNLAFSKWLNEHKTLIAKLDNLNEVVLMDEEAHANEIVFNLQKLYEDFEVYAK